MLSKNPNPQDEPAASDAEMTTDAFIAQAEAKRQIYQAAATNDKRKIAMTRETVGGADQMQSYIVEHQQFVTDTQVGNLPQVPPKGN